VDRQYIQSAKDEIEKWEGAHPGFLAHVGDFMFSPAENAARALIPVGFQNTVSKAIHRLITGLSSAAHRISNEEKIYYRIETAYREHGDHLKAADVVAKHCWYSNVAYAAGEGGTTGAIGFAGLAADVPALLTITLRMIRQIGICYAYDTTSDVEREYVMHVLRVGSTSNLRAKMECLVALKQFEQILLKVSWQAMSEAFARKEISRLSLLAAARQLSQKLGVQLTRRKALQLVPVVGALVGASFNAVFVNDVGRAAYMLYRRRRIAESEGPVKKLLGVSPAVVSVSRLP